MIWDPFFGELPVACPLSTAYTQCSKFAELAQLTSLTSFEWWAGVRIWHFSPPRQASCNREECELREVPNYTVLYLTLPLCILSQWHYQQNSKRPFRLTVRRWKLVGSGIRKLKSLFNQNSTCYKLLGSVENHAMTINKVGSISMHGHYES